MASAPVVIDMGMAEPAQLLVASMIEACGKAVPEGGCHLVREAPQGPYRAIAILTWEGTDKVRIEVGLQRERGTEWRTRSLVFQPHDADIERFRSVGFVVGTLAAEDEAEAPPPPLAPPPAPVRTTPSSPPPKSRPPAPRPAPRPSAVGLVGTLGGGLDEGGPRYGAGLRGRFGITPVLGIIGGLDASIRPRDDSDVALRFLAAGIGLGIVLHPPSPLGWELGVEGLVEHFRADVRAGDESDAKDRVLPTLRAQVEAVWAVSPPFELSLGGNAVARPESTTIVVRGETVGSTGVLELGLVAGVRLEL